MGDLGRSTASPKFSARDEEFLFRAAPNTKHPRDPQREVRRAVLAPSFSRLTILRWLRRDGGLFRMHTGEQRDREVIRGTKRAPGH